MPKKLSEDLEYVHQIYTADKGELNRCIKIFRGCVADGTAIPEDIMKEFLSILDKVEFDIRNNTKEKAENALKERIAALKQPLIERITKEIINNKGLGYHPKNRDKDTPILSKKVAVFVKGYLAYITKLALQDKTLLDTTLYAGYNIKANRKRFVTFTHNYLSKNLFQMTGICFPLKPYFAIVLTGHISFAFGYYHISEEYHNAPSKENGYTKPTKGYNKRLHNDFCGLVNNQSYNK